MPGGAAEQAEVRKGRGPGCNMATEMRNCLSGKNGKGDYHRHTELLEQRQDGFSESMSVVGSDIILGPRDEIRVKSEGHIR